MIFEGNIASDLGINYHTYQEALDTKKNEVVIRYLLEEPLTFEQLGKISRYENFDYKKEGATYKYAPEIKYDVLYVKTGKTPEEYFGTGEDEDVEEAIDEPPVENGSPVALPGEAVTPGNSPEEYSALAGLSSQIDSLIVSAQTLGEFHPEYTPMINDLITSLKNSLASIQGLKISSLEPGVPSEEVAPVLDDMEVLDD